MNIKFLQIILLSLPQFAVMHSALCVNLQIGSNNWSMMHILFTYRVCIKKCIYTWISLILNSDPNKMENIFESLDARQFLKKTIAINKKMWDYQTRHFWWINFKYFFVYSDFAYLPANGRKMDMRQDPIFFSFFRFSSNC